MNSGCGGLLLLGCILSGGLLGFGLLGFALLTLGGFGLLSDLGLALGGSHIVAQNHHAQECAGNLTKPSETSEEHKGTGDKSQKAGT